MAMRGERTSDLDALINRYGLSQRLAARIVALLSKKVDLSRTLLETAASDAALEEILLDPGLLTDPKALTQQRLRARAGESGFRDGELLRMVRGPEGWRTIALEDDVLAEQAQAQAGETLGSSDLVRAAPGGISRLETEGLFTPEDVARLKLAALTSQKTDERIEALRKLAYAPLPGAQKASIFVNVLVDPSADAQVRREAVRSLEQIGFRSELADTVGRLFDAQEEDVIYAVQRIGALLTDADEAETGVALAVILELFNESDSTEVLLEFLRLVTQSASILVNSPQKTEQFIQSTLRHLAKNFDELRLGVEEALHACHRQAPEAVAELLWKEIGRSEDACVRSFLVNFSAAITEDAERLKQLARAAVSEIMNPSVREQERSHLRYGLVRLGECAADAVIERLQRETGQRCSDLIRLLDVVCTEGEVSDKTVNDAMRMLLGLMQVGEQVTRRTILEAALCADPRVEHDLQSSVAGELLSHIPESALPSTVETIHSTLGKIGPPALRPLLDYVVRRFPHEDAEPAFATLARIAEAHGQAMPEELWQEIFDYCMRLFDDAHTKQGGFTITLASLCGYPPAGADVFERVLKAMKEKLWKARYTFDIFDALGVMAGSENAKQKHQRELFKMFDEIVNMKGPERIGVKRQTEDGPVYEFGPEILFDTRVVPAVVRGLERICVSRRATTALRREVVKRLLILWEGVANVRIVWSPSAIGALIRAMCSAARCAEVKVDMHIRLTESLLRFLNKVSVVRSMGEICSVPRTDKKMLALCLKTGEMMLEEWETCDQQDDERRLALLKSLAQIASNTSLKRRDRAVKRLRDNVLGALFQALRAGVHEVRAPLELMLDCPDLPKKQRDDIRDRLSRAVGLVRIRHE